VTAATARLAGLTVAATAAQASVESLADAVVAALAGSPLD
jgi:hypothetical protein